MKNKKGFLLAEETLKIVIALICISFLVYFLVSLYMSNKEDKDLELAKASLEHLISEINAEHPEVEIYNPEGWVISSWSSDGIRPNQCSNMGWNNCLCICEDLSLLKKGTNVVKGLFVKNNDIESFAKKCDKKGICLENDFIVKDKKIKLEDPPIILQIQSGEITKK